MICSHPCRKVYFYSDTLCMQAYLFEFHHLPHLCHLIIPSTVYTSPIHRRIALTLHPKCQQQPKCHLFFERLDEKVAFKRLSKDLQLQFRNPSPITTLYTLTSIILTLNYRPLVSETSLNFG